MSLRRHAFRAVLLACLLAQTLSVSAATFVVTTTADIGDGTCNSTECTLREAITAANATAAADTINFAIALPIKGQLLIPLLSPLPTITQPLTIDGYSQSGTAVNTALETSDAKLRIRVDGLTAGNARGLAVCANNVTIKGLSVTRFVQSGIVFGTQSNGTFCSNASAGGVVAGNFVGLQADGITAAGNSGDGIQIRSAVVRIGGSAVADRNVVAANIAAGISLSEAVAGSQIENNLIGTDKSGTLDRGNGGIGVDLGTNVAGIVIGTQSTQNLIAHNFAGIRVNGVDGTGMTFFANRFVTNDGLGINLGGDAVTGNDVDDDDTGPNGLQNFPLISDAIRTDTGVSANMSLDVGHSTTFNYRIGLYASASCDSSGHGEGEVLIAQQLRGLSSSNQSFTMTALPTEPLAPGTVLTATATAPDGSTSEFSPCFFVDPPPLLVNSTADPGTGGCDVAECTLREAITVANATALTADTIHFAITAPVSGELLIQPTTPLPTITSPVTIDGYSQTGTLPNIDPVASNATLRVRVDGALAGPIDGGFAICADQVTIRGLSITGFGSVGIGYGRAANGAACALTNSDGRVVGNFIGLRTDGITADGNLIGIFANQSSFRVGGSSPADRNLISSNAGVGTGQGMLLDGQASSSSIIENNLIGTDRTGLLIRGNEGAGIDLFNNVSDTLIGTTTHPNLIAHNGLGILLRAGSNQRNSLFANRFFQNTGLGIDLADNGATANDTDDADSGPNDLQNSPALDTAQRSVNGLLVAGTLDVPTGTNDALYTIAIYANDSCDGSGLGEGERLLGTRSVSLTQTSGESFSFDLATDDPLPAGTEISATATSPDGSTSEFFACTLVTESPQLFADGFEN